jgi:hypothetical protein
MRNENRYKEQNKMNTNLVIVPTRSRPDNAERFAKHFFETSKISDLVFGIDDDQIDLYPKIDDVIYDINPNMKLVPKLNLLANKYKDKYETITFLGDDHLLITDGWDQSLYIPIKQTGYGFSFANDLLFKESLPTCVMASTNIIKSLGYMTPPILWHMYIDNFWKMLGSRLNAIFYFPEVYWENLTYQNGKAKMDDSYRETSTYLERDKFAFHEYLADDFQNDLQKIKKDLKIG